jgi:mannose-1-phosphate guanylyltransferase
VRPARQAVLLVGGEGRRLRPLTDTRPKPMMPLVDRPFIAHQLDLLRRHGLTDVVFSCGYRPDALRAHFGDGSAAGVRLRDVVDPEPLGTAGAVANAADLLLPESVLVLNGDILTDLDLDALGEDHRASGAAGTIALTPVDDPSAYGLVRLDDAGTVEAFVEKPTPDQLRPGEPFRINAGTYLLEPEVLERIPRGRACSIEREVFPPLAAEGRLHGFPSAAYWRDIGTPASYLQALDGVLRTESPTGPVYLGPGAVVEEGAEVGPGASLGPAARVAAGARVTHSVIGEGAIVERDAVVEGAVVGAGARVEAGAVLEPGAVVGDEAVIGAGSRIGADAPVPTGATVGAPAV